MPYVGGLKTADQDEPTEQEVVQKKLREKENLKRLRYGLFNNERSKWQEIAFHLNNLN